MKTIAIDFDGVIHSYDKGWQGGVIYGTPIEGVFEAIDGLIKDGYNVFILSTRNSKQIKEWLTPLIMESEWVRDGLGDPNDFMYAKYSFTVEVIPFWWHWFNKFWNKPNVVGITNVKLPAFAYVDDRAICFKGDWNLTIEDIKNFKVYKSE